mgnify:CR=1 FL=1
MQLSDPVRKAMGSALLELIKLSELNLYADNGDVIVTLPLGSFRQVKAGVVETLATAQGYAITDGTPARYDVRRNGNLVMRGEASDLGLTDSLPSGALVSLSTFVYEVANGV